MEIIQIKETCLYISDLAEAKRFYNGLLEFEIINAKKDRFIFFSVGSSVLLCFNPEQSKTNISPPPHFAHGPQHIAFEVTVEEYELWKEKIKTLKIKLIDEITWKNGMRSFYFLGPSNHVLEIVPKGVWD